MAAASQRAGKAKAAIMRSLRFRLLLLAPLLTYASPSSALCLCCLRQRKKKYGRKHSVSPKNMNALWTAGCLNVSSSPDLLCPTGVMSCMHARLSTSADCLSYLMTLISHTCVIYCKNEGEAALFNPFAGLFAPDILLQWC